jgi:hypothetical protein
LRLGSGSSGAAHSESLPRRRFRPESSSDVGERFVSLPGEFELARLPRLPPFDGDGDFFLGSGLFDFLARSPSRDFGGGSSTLTSVRSERSLDLGRDRRRERSRSRSPPPPRRGLRLLDRRRGDLERRRGLLDLDLRLSRPRSLLSTGTRTPMGKRGGGRSDDSQRLDANYLKEVVRGMYESGNRAGGL